MSTQCYVCAKHVVKSEEVQRSHAVVYRVSCPRCGTYDIAHRYISGEREQPSLTDIERVGLSHAIRKATDAHERFTEELLNYETVKPLIERHPVPDPVDQADLLIDAIARRCSFGELTVEESIDAWAARIGLKGALELKTMYMDLEPLIRQSGLGAPRSAIPGDLHTKAVGFSLTLEGWRRAREIRQHRGPGNQAFVAMWFHPDMLAAYTEGFAPALLDTGYAPYRVDRAAHNNKIDDEIIAEIRRSRLLVVDATGARPNAHWEAGFAKGLGMDVIWCCNGSWEACMVEVAPNSSIAAAPKVRSWMEVLALDTRQHSFVVWTDTADLRTKLTARIRALGFDAAWNRQR